MSIFSEWWNKSIKSNKDYHKKEQYLWEDIRQRIDSYVEREEDGVWFILTAIDEIFQTAAITKDKERTGKVMVNIINWIKENTTGI